MAQNDAAVVTAAYGYIYTAPNGTPAPTPAQLKTINLSNPSSWTATGWTSAGHTSENKLPEWGFSGGEPETKGSWQKRKLRDIDKGDRVDFLTATLLQFDLNSLGLYYGANTSSVPGEYGVSGDPDVNEKAVLVVIVDGALRLGFYVYRASVTRDSKIDLPKDDLAMLPVKFKFLDYANQPTLFKWISLDLFAVDSPVTKQLRLNGATGGTYTLQVDGVSTAAINWNDTSAAVKAALVAVDDGLSASAFSVTTATGGFDIVTAATVTLGVSSTTGGTGVTVT
jgi:hypothetical protein